MMTKRAFHKLQNENKCGRKILVPKRRNVPASKCGTWNGVASKGPVNFILPKLSLCGYYQSLVYKDHPVNLAQLNSNIGQVDKTSASIIAMAVRTKLCKLNKIFFVQLLTWTLRAKFH